MQITVFEHRTARQAEVEELASLLQSNELTVWIDITGPTEEDLDVMRNVFRFHSLAIEDTRLQRRRPVPKAEEFTDYLFVVLSVTTDKTLDPRFRELDIFLGHNFFVTSHNRYEGIIGQTRSRIDPMRLKFPVSSTYLLYILMDVMFDDYFPVLDLIEEEITRLSNTMLNNPNKQVLDRLFRLKRTLSNIWRILWPQGEIVNILNNHNLTYIDPNCHYYLRDISDHLVRVRDTVQYFSETLNGLINLYTSAVSNRVNEVVTRLTIVTVTFGALAVIVGFYGMNFEQTWPPFDTPWGVWFALGLMVVTFIVAFMMFRRKE
jgi:magnesium transporter